MTRPFSDGRWGGDPLPVSFCADDYGLTPSIGEAVRALLTAGRISATSAMTGAAHWPSEGAMLRALPQQGSVGLHFTLTDLAPITRMARLAPDGRLPSLSALMAKAYLGRLDAREIRRELDAQLDSFERVMGRPPDHLDGHHHVHQLPVVADVVLDVAIRRLGGAILLRYCDEPLRAVIARPMARPRALLIALIGSRFARRARALGIVGNQRFRGVRDFTPGEDVARHFAEQVRAPEPGLWIMCHPGAAPPEPAPEDIPEDMIAALREGEYRFLMSDAFPALLARTGLRIGTPRETALGPGAPS